MDDWELLEQYRSGRSQRAFAELVERHSGLVYGVCRRRAHDAHLAEDLTQAVFLLLSRRPPKRRGNAALAGWLYQTAVYACMNATRAQRIRERHEQQAAEERAAVAPDRDSAPPDLELAEEMDRALASLPAGDRDALLLRYYQGMTVGAVGRALGVTEDTAAKRLSRAVERLRRAVLRTRDAVGSGGRMQAAGAPLSAAAFVELFTRVTQSPAPSAVQAQLAALATGGATPSLLAEHVCDAVVATLKAAQLKLLATVGAVALLVAGGGVVVTSAVLRERPAPRAGLDPVPAQSSTDSAHPQSRAAALVEEGWALWRRQEYRSAAEKFQQAIDLAPDASGAWNGLGWAYFHLPDRDRARTAFERCLELEPNQGAALNGLGQVALSQGDYAQAERALLKGAATAPAAAHGLVRLYLLQARWDEARRWVDRTRAVEPSMDDDPMFKRMAAAANERRLDDELRAALSPRAPGPADAFVRSGWGAMNAGRFDDAEQAFEQGLAAAPDDPDALSGMGWLRLNTGAADEAVELFGQALDRRHDHIAAANGLASAYKRLGRIDDAIRVWQDLARRAPSSGVGQFGLAQTYLEQSKFDKALPLFEQLAATMPNNPTVQAGLERARSGARR